MIDETSVADLIATQMPSLRGLPITRIAGGQDHEMFAAGEDWLVRFPNTPERAAWLEREVALLALVSETIPHGVPRAELVGRVSGAPSHPFLAYRRVPGVAVDRAPTIDPATFAADVGDMLNLLHHVDAERVPPVPAGWNPVPIGYESLPQSDAAAAARLLPAGLAELARPYLAGLVPVPAREAPRRFIHNDICPDHLIVDPDTGRLNGVIDFADAIVGDPVWDFVGLIPLGGRSFIDLVLGHYCLPLGSGFDSTLRWLSRTLTLRWLADAAQHNPGHVPKHLRWVEAAFAAGT